MLANLAMKEFDARMTELARGNGLEYSRYADDITLSTGDKGFTRDRAVRMIGRSSSLMGEFGLSPNTAKTRISPPGSRKVVLGLLVDGAAPRLTRRFRQGLRQHLHYLLHSSVGPVLHAQARGFVATASMRNHVWGLIAFAYDIDPAFAQACARQFERVTWPT
jgi:RNA-directed DNA polymerase